MTRLEHDRRINGGVDTHGHTWHAAVIDELGRRLADREFLPAPASSQRLRAFLAAHGRLQGRRPGGHRASGVRVFPLRCGHLDTRS